MGGARPLNADRVAAALIFATLIAGCSGTASIDPAAIADQRSVGITATGCGPTPAFGAGAVIGDGLIATSAHVVAGATGLVVQTHDGETHAAHTVAIDPDQDVALIEASELDIEPIEIGEADAGDQVTFVGFRDGERERRSAEIRRRVNLSTGDIYRAGDVDRPGYELRGSIDSGDSGAILVNDQGEAVGVIWSSSIRVDDRGWAVRMEAVADLIMDPGTDPGDFECAPG
ncbi:MAG: trypsin-like peptidase domain-containing protein [Acidobacteria bacterium]|nr:trypsin-like peptidase domain-containing protein [Acidobacteriota bacterium]